MVEPVYAPVIVTALGAFKALGLKLDVTGGEHVPRTGGAVLASNHVGYLDFTFVGWGVRPRGRLVRFMAKEAVFRHRVSGPLMRGMHHIAVDRAAGSQAFRDAMTMLKAGEVVGVGGERLDPAVVGEQGHVHVVGHAARLAVGAVVARRRRAP